jgi:hypothetical protein
MVQDEASKKLRALAWATQNGTTFPKAPSFREGNLPNKDKLGFPRPYLSKSRLHEQVFQQSEIYAAAI